MSRHRSQSRGARRRAGARRVAPDSAWRRLADSPVPGAWLRFLAGFGALYALAQWDPAGLLPRLCEAHAQLLAWALWLLGAEGRADGVFVTSTLHPVRIVTECTALVPMLLFSAAVLAHPCGPRHKLRGLALGLPALVLVNLVRLLSLAWASHHTPRSFEAFHLLFWQSLIVFLTVLAWVLWTAAPGEHRDHRPA